jgi:hypothetical protein
MHSKEHKPDHGHEEDRREAVIAADDTGLVQQQEVIVETELGLPVDEGHEAKHGRHER